MTSKAGKSFSGKLFLDKTEKKLKINFVLMKTKTDLLTAKSVIKEDLRTGIRYYDHHIHDNPKELYLDTKKAEADFQTGYRITEPVRPENQTSAFYYDKRLYEICQCPTNSNCKEFLFSSCFIQSLQVTSAVKYRMKHRSDALSDKRN